MCLGRTTFSNPKTSSNDCNNPSYVYSGQGTFTVTLTITGTDGTDTETKMNLIEVEGMVYVFVPVILNP